MFNKGIQFFREVKSELRDVSWPSKNEVKVSTTLTIIFVIIISSFLGITDFILSSGISPFFTGTVNGWSGLLFAFLAVVVWVVYSTTKG